MKKNKMLLILAIGLFMPVVTIMASNPEGIITLSNNLTVVVGGGGNSGILVTDRAVVVIDTKMGDEAKKLYDMVKEKAGDKQIIVINTHYHADHVSGNHFYKGSKIYMGNYDKAFLEKQLEPENMPTDFVKDSLILNLGTETVEIYNLGQAHTWQDMVVYLKKNKVLFSGDLVFYKVIPFVMQVSGANVDKWIAALNKIINHYDYQTLVPGHGDPGGKELPKTLKAYFTDMKMAAKNPSKEKELITKYKDWATAPTMATPRITIDYIRNSK